MRQPLSYSRNEHTRNVARAHAAALQHLIPDDCPERLGFTSKVELIMRHCIDNVQYALAGTLTREETRKAVTDDRVFPGLLCYRSLDDLDGPIAGAECRVQVLDPRLGTGGMWAIYSPLVELGWMEEIFTRAIEDSCQVAGKLQQFHVSSNIGRSILLYRDRQNRTFIDRMSASMKEAGIRDERVHLELVEAIPHLEDEHVEVLRQATQRNIGIFIDDCGEGHSATLLQECRSHALPVHTLKMCAGITTATHERQLRDVETWMQRADGMDIRSLVFEGFQGSLITPAVIDRLHRTRERMEATIPWHIEGPIFPDA